MSIKNKLNFNKKKLVSHFLIAAIFIFTITVLYEQKNVEGSNNTKKAILYPNYDNFLNKNKEITLINNKLIITSPNKEIYLDKLFSENEIKDYNYKILFNFTFEKVNFENSETEFYFGFGPYGQVALDKNYFKFQTKNNLYQLIHHGDKLFYLHNPKEIKNTVTFQLEYNFNINSSKVNLEINTQFNKNKFLSGDLDKEFFSGYGAEHIWIGIPNMKNGIITINDFHIEYY